MKELDSFTDGQLRAELARRNGLKYIDATTEDYLGLCEVMSDAYSDYTWRMVKAGDNHVLMLLLEHDYDGSEVLVLYPEQVLELAQRVKDSLAEKQQPLVATIDDVVYLRDHPEEKGERL